MSESELGPVHVTISLEPEAPVIGDRLILVIEAIAEPEIEVLMPDFGDGLDRFEIVDFAPRESLDEDGKSVFRQRYSLKAPRSGQHIVPAILIEFVDRRPGHDPAPEDQDAYELLTDPIAFDVASVVPDVASAELSPPLGELSPLGSASGPIWPWLLAILLVLLSGAPFAYRAYISWRTGAERRSAYQIARDQLDELLAQPRPEADAIDGFFVSLSQIVRSYLEMRFELRSPELTTERFLEVVSESPDLSDDHQSLLGEFLVTCDLVKFAHHIPSPESTSELVELARRFIEDTRNVDLEAAEAGA
jgi:hypothetical protein